MLADMSSGGSKLTPREGTYLIGVVNFLSSGLSIFTAKYFTRRRIFIVGHIAMGIALLCVGLFAYLKKPTMVLVSMLCFIFSF